MPMIAKPSMRAWTLIETLVCVGVISILLALLLPALHGTRTPARQAVTASNARTIGIALRTYADSFHDLTPVLFDPVDKKYPPRSNLQTVRVNGRVVQGLWFYTCARYQFALSPALPASVLVAPGNKGYQPQRVDGTTTSDRTDLQLTETMYARPEYWDRRTQVGASQWAPQKWGDIRYPSDKGFLWQQFVYGLPNRPYQQFTGQFASVMSTVLWADLHAEVLDQSLLPPGEPNLFYHSPPWDRSILTDGLAVAQTKHGIFGRDRK
jgi:type II secretory pathway pseudopilin PulG